jgi:ABC-type iron transport system FetAB ATPase subunit
MDWIDEMFEHDLTGLKDFILSLIPTSTLCELSINEIVNKLDTSNKEELEAIILNLNNNQRCAIECGFNYSQSDILKKLNKL